MGLYESVKGTEIVNINPITDFINFSYQALYIFISIFVVFYSTRKKTIIEIFIKSILSLAIIITLIDIILNIFYYGNIDFFFRNQKFCF